MGWAIINDIMMFMLSWLLYCHNAQTYSTSCST